MNLKRTHLHQEHINLNARLVDFAGWEMPIQYTGLKDEAQAVRNNVGMFDVSHMGEFFVEGNEAQEFLDFLLTNNVQGLPDFKAMYSPLCNHDAKILDDLIIYKFNSNKFLICVNASNIEKDFDWFKENIANFDCELTDRSDDYSLIALQGPKSQEVLTAIEIDNNLSSLEYYAFTQTDDLIIARTGYTGEDGFEIFGPHEKIKHIWNQLALQNVVACGLGARDILRLEVCYPLYGHELTSEVTPLDSALKWTVKMDKEDFIGKSALEGYKAQSQLIKLLLNKGIPRQGYEVVQNDQTIGHITSGTQSVSLGQGIAIARVNKNNYCPTDKIYVKIREKLFEAAVTKKAFVQGGHK